MNKKRRMICCFCWYNYVLLVWLITVPGTITAASTTTIGSRNVHDDSHSIQNNRWMTGHPAVDVVIVEGEENRLMTTASTSVVVADGDLVVIDDDINHTLDISLIDDYHHVDRNNNHQQMIDQVNDLVVVSASHHTQDDVVIMEEDKNLFPNSRKSHRMIDQAVNLSIDDVDQPMNRKTVMIRTNNDDDRQEWTMINHSKALRSSSSSGHNNNHRIGQQQRMTQSCVSSLAALKSAVAKATTKSTTQIRVCTSKIKLGSLNRRRRRRRHRHLRLDQTRELQGSLIGLGGGIDVSNRSILFTCLLKKRCILDGEGISRIFYGTNATIAIDGFQFYNASSTINDALGSGSALTMMGSSNIIIKDCSFHYNTAPNNGGAIMMNQSQLIFKSSHRKIRFYKNRAKYGGAIHCINNGKIQTNITSSTRRRTRTTLRHRTHPSSNATLEFVAFESNYASQDGGAIHVDSGIVSWDRVNMENNDAANGGAAVLIKVNGIMTNVNISGNTANGTGGALLMVNSTLSIANSTFNSNDNNGTIGAITALRSPVTVTSTTFINSCWSDGSICITGGTCNYCCNASTFWVKYLSNACGPERCWEDGLYCAVGTTCDYCCHGSSFWSGLFFTACGFEPTCYPSGTNCLLGTTCTTACCSGSGTFQVSPCFCAKCN